MRFLFGVVAILTLSGCTSVPMASRESSAEAKKLATKPNLGQIFVCRENAIMGMGIRPNVVVDGKIIGEIGVKTFAYKVVEPGDHLLSVKTYNHDSDFPFTIAAGEQKFFQAWIAPGFGGGWGIVDEMDKVKAKACIADGELVASPQ